MRSEAVANQNPWFVMRPCFGLEIKDTREPVQADLGVGISRLGACIVPSRGGISGPVAPMGRGWPDNQREERPTVCRYALDRSYHHSLDARASIISWIVPTYQDFKRAEHAQHDSRFVHIIDILRLNDRVMHLLPNDLKPVYNLILDVDVVSLPV